ncbi:hypothetical protein D3227_40935, partial [Mesorhizobium waimense]
MRRWRRDNAGEPYEAVMSMLIPVRISQCRMPKRSGESQKGLFCSDQSTSDQGWPWSLFSLRGCSCSIRTQSNPRSWFTNRGSSLRYSRSCSLCS